MIVSTHCCIALFLTVTFNWKCASSSSLLGVNTRANYPRTSLNSRSMKGDSRKFCEEISSDLLREIHSSAYNSRYMSIDKPKEEPKHSPNSQEGGIGQNGPSDEATRIYKDTVQASNEIPSFAVSQDFHRIISNEPAWALGMLHKRGVPILKSLNLSLTEGMNQGQKVTTTAESGDALKQARSNPIETGNAYKTMLTSVPQNGQRNKRTAPRPWVCDTRIRWIDLGDNYFPRYLRSVECVSETCWYGKYSCKPRAFTVKLLRRQNEFCVPKDGQLKPVKLTVTSLPNELQELWVWEERAVSFCCECVENDN